jgi:hypothetical protein
VQQETCHHEGDARDVLNGGHLAQDDRAYDGGEHRQQREHERERSPRQPRHRQLIAGVGDHRRAHADSGAGQQQHGIPECGQGVAQPPRRRRHGRDQHGRAEPVDASRRAARIGYPVAEHDVQHEQRAVGKGEDEPERVTGKADHGDGSHACRGERERSSVAPGPRPGGGQDHSAAELDRAHRRQRQPVHGEVERRVHDGEHHAEGDQGPPAARAEFRYQPPRSPPGGEHRRRAGDAQPGDPEHADAGEQQHRQRRSEVMEDGADKEKRLRRQSAEPPIRRVRDLCGLRCTRHRCSI